MARHTTVNLDTVSKCPDLLIEELKQTPGFISPDLRW